MMPKSGHLTTPKSAHLPASRLRKPLAGALACALVIALVVALPGCAARPDRARMAPAAAIAFDQSLPDVEVENFEWLDTARNRAVPARLYLPKGEARLGPAGPDAGKPVAANAARQIPLVVFSHGLGGSRYSFSHLGRYWASQGVASLHLQHTGSDREVWSARGLSLIGTLWAAATTEQAIARAEDVSFALDRLLLEPIGIARIDAQRIGVAGHSFGANTALLTSGARFKDGGQVLSYTDPRIKAAVIMSPPSLPSSYDPAFVYSSITVPTLHLTGTADSTPIPGLSTSPEERRIPFDNMAATPRYLGIYQHGRHAMFNDRSRDADSEAIKASCRELTLAFWKSVFEGDAAATATLARLEKAMSGAAGPLAAWEIKP